MELKDAGERAEEVAFYTPRVNIAGSKPPGRPSLETKPMPATESTPSWIQLTFPKSSRVAQEPTQLNLPSDIVPATAAAARVRATPADVAAQQLDTYLARLQRNRATPLTSEVRIQPRLF
jgi:hypothetical protein